MSILDFIITLCLSLSMFMVFCCFYQRNFIICDKLIFESQKSINKSINDNIRHFEKMNEIKSEQGFVRDHYSNCDLHYYIMFSDSFKKTLIFFHGNKGSIDRHLNKCYAIHYRLQMNIMPVM